ncbi:hypothetical protein [Leptolyngbya ohadii]|uniref:hypothetical protein n=1 Tax=Leptolyngbya ohadii TaxID=1962290 RepID=UPI0015C5D809|nr:hypothetical protein [Leptolyngbya ohadii]
MVRAILIVILTVFTASSALAQIPEDHRGSGRYSENPTMPEGGRPGRTHSTGTR